MEINKKQSAILYLDRNGFYFYEDGVNSVITMAFAENSIKDMEIISSAALSAQIKTFIEQYNLLPANIQIIASPNLIFEKDIAGLSPEAQKVAAEKFTDTVPFESVISKEFPIDKGVKVIGCNEDLYLEIKSGFEKNAFNVESLIPYQLLGVDQALIQNFTPENALTLLRKIDQYKKFTLLTDPKSKVMPSQQPTASSDGKTTQPAKKINVRLFVMIGVFAVLFAILGFMLLNMK